MTDGRSNGRQREGTAQRAPAARLHDLAKPYDPLTSLALTMPVFVVYHLGILFTDLRNGADLVTGIMVALIERSLAGYVACTLGIAVAIVLVGTRLRTSHRIELRALPPLLGESALWAVVLALVVGHLTARLVDASWLGGAPFDLRFDLQLGPRKLGSLERIVMAAGAGFHEEVVFRVGLFGLGARVLQHRGVGRLRSELVMAPLAALVFSAMHYVGSLGDSFGFASFTFRVLMGLALTALYRFRGFAVAVYTHVVYDLLVFFVFRP